MEENLIYIDQHVEGVWDNERFSLVIGPKDIHNKRLLSLTDKENNASTGSGLVGYINKRKSIYILTIITDNNESLKAKDYQISIDAMINQLTLSTDGAVWTFKRHF